VPSARRNLVRITAKAAGKSARYDTRTAAASTDTSVGRPPNVDMVSTSQ
jgi:hypothetical protein